MFSAVYWLIVRATDLHDFSVKTVWFVEGKAKLYVVNFSGFVAEALHIAHLMGAHGYIFPIDDHILTVKNDGAYYRFQVCGQQ